MNRIVRNLAIVVFSVALAASLAGCRISPALIDTIYTADATETDPDVTASEFTDDAAEKEDAPQNRKEAEADDYNSEINRAEALQTEKGDEDISSREEADSQEVSDSLDKSGHTGNDSISGNGGDKDSSGESDSDSASEGFEDGVAESSTDSGTESGTADDSEQKESAGSDDNSGDNEDSGNVSDAPVKDVPKKVVTDASGTEQEIPEDVYTVTAVGAAAPIVAMVGGVGRLIATSESFVSNDLGSIIIENCSDAEISTWWSGEGSEGISDENFEALLQASPDVCFEISGEATFSSVQITKLQEHGIGYLVLPELSSGENLKDAVMIVAEALVTNEDTGQSAVAIANEYGDWVDECLEYAADNRKTLDYYSIYISEWRDDVSFSRRYEPGYTDVVVDFPESSGMAGGRGTGVAVASADVDGQPFFEFWEAAGVYDVITSGLAYSTERPDLKGYKAAYVFPYEMWFGVPTFSDQSVFFAFDYGGTSDIYLHTVVYGAYTMAIPGTAFGEILQAEKHLGGSERYSAIVVADTETKEKISNSPQWKAGFLNGISVAEYAIDIAGDYEIYVNPTGFGNWAEGSVDSPLEAYWILYKISGGISSSQLQRKVRAFYSDFYGITLTSSQINNMVNQ